MKLEEFLSELTYTTRVVKVECHSDKKESIKEFMKIGKELHNSFEHVRGIF